MGIYKLVATLIWAPTFLGVSYLFVFVGMIIGTTFLRKWKERIQEKYFFLHCVAVIISITLIVLYIYLILKS